MEKALDFLQEQLKQTTAMLQQFQNLNNANDNFLEEMKSGLSEKDRSIVESFQAKAQGILSTAKAGGDYSELLKQATEEAQKLRDNGGSSNK